MSIVLTTGGRQNPMQAGSVTSPSWYFEGDQDTGFYQPAGDTIGIVAGGSEIVRVTTGGLDMQNNVISNIGAAGTDFSATGGLTLAGQLTVPNGSAAVPGIRTNSEAHGLFRASATGLGIAIAGVVKVVVNASGVGMLDIGTAGVGTAADGISLNTDVGNIGPRFTRFMRSGSGRFDLGYDGILDVFFLSTTTAFITQIDRNGSWVFTPAAVAGGASTITVTPGAHTAVVAETIAHSHSAQTITITAGYATQRFINIAQPTISAATALTVADAVTFNIAGAPTPAGVGPATLTRAFALRVEAGISAFYGTVQLGLAGTTLGVLTFNGNTSGTITVQSAAAAGTWTLTLPPDDGDAGEQLQTNGSGVTTWEAAASTRDKKHVYGRSDSQLALQRILDMPIYNFRYRSPNHTTGDIETMYVGPMAEESPFVMHHGERILNPINTFGYTTLAIQALHQRIADLEQEIQILKS